MTGPSVRKLIATKMASQMVGPNGHIGTAIDAIMKPGNLAAHGKIASDFVVAAIAAVKSAPNNPYGDNDEAIAAEILRRIDGKKKIV